MSKVHPPTIDNPSSNLTSITIASSSTENPKLLPRNLIASPMHIIQLRYDHTQSILHSPLLLESLTRECASISSCEWWISG